MVIKLRIVLEMAYTNGVPKPSWTSLRSVTADLKQVRISSRRNSVAVWWRGISDNSEGHDRERLYVGLRAIVITGK
jgi:hypothetical protein